MMGQASLNGYGTVYLRIVRMLVYGGALVRFVLHRTEGVFSEAFIVAALGVALGIIEVWRSPRAPKWRRFLVYSDVVFISLLYAMTRTMESDFFIFYLLPIATAAEDSGFRRIRTTAAVAGVGLAATILYLASVQTVGIERLLIAILLPREFCLFLVAVVSSDLIRARAVSSSLDELARAAASAATLDRELDVLLDDVVSLGFDRAAIGVVDEWMNVIHVVRARNVSPREMLMSRSDLASQDLMPDVVRSGKVTLFHAGDKEDQKLQDALHDRGLSHAFVPVIAEKSENKVVGVVHCGSLGPPPKDRLKGLAEIVRQTAAQRADAIDGNRPHILLANTCQKVVEIVGADSASIHVYQESTMLYQAGAGKADPAFLRKFPPRPRQGLGRRAMDEGKPITRHCEDVRVEHPGLFEAGVRAMTAFPLLDLGGRDLRGVLYIHFWRPRNPIARSAEKYSVFANRNRLSQRTLALVSYFAEKLGSVIQNYLSLRTSAEAAERTWQVSLLQNFIQSLASQHEPRELLEKIAKSALQYLPESDCVSLYEYVEVDENGNRITLPPEMRNADPREARGYFEQPVTAGEFLFPHEILTEIRAEATGRLLNHINESRWVEDVATHPELNRPHVNSNRRRFIDREQIKSSAQLLLRNLKNQIVGILFINYRTRRQYNLAEWKAIDSFASAAAIAISNARMLAAERDQKRQIDRLLAEERSSNQQINRLRNTIAEIQSPFRSGQVAQKILQQLQEIAAFDSATVQLVKGENRFLLEAVGFDRGSANPFLTRPLSSDPLVKRVLEQRTPTILHDTSRERGWVTPEARSWMGLPLYSADVVVGLITADCRRADAFRGIDLCAVERLVAHAGMELRKAVEYDEAHRKIEHLELLREVHETIDNNFTTDRLVAAIAQQVSKKMRCDQCSIFLKEQNGSSATLRPKGTEGKFSHKVLGRGPLKVVDGMAPTSSPILLAFRDNRYVLDKGENHRGSEQRHFPRSVVAAPISVGEHKIGVIAVEKNAAAFFGETDAIAVDAIAHYTGRAIERDRGLQLIQEVGGKILEAKEVGEVLQKIVSGVVSLMDVDNAAIFLRGDPDQPSSWEHFIYPPTNLPGPRAGGLTENILKTGEAVVIPNVRDTSENVSAGIRQKYESLLGLPVTMGSRVEGALFLLSMSPREFNLSEMSLLRSLVNQAALVIQKTRRLATAQGQLREAETQKIALTRLLGINVLSGALFHYLRTPVNSFPVHSATIRSVLTDGAQAVDRNLLAAVEAIEAASARIQNLMRRIDDSMSRHALGRIETVTIGRLLNQACEQVHVNWMRDFVRCVEPRKFDEIAETIQTQESIMAEAIANIIANAVEAVREKEGGIVQIRTSRCEGSLVVEVSDNGGGIAEEDLKRLGHFGFSKGKKDGVGFGLWFSKQVFSAAGIKLDFQSEQGKGTACLLTFRAQNGLHGNEPYQEG